MKTTMGVAAVWVVLLGGCAGTQQVEIPSARAEKNFVQLCRVGTAAQVAAGLKAGADANAPDGSGCTPLLAASMYNPDPGVVRALVEAGAHVNEAVACRDSQEVWVGVNRAHADIAEKLETEGQVGWTPLLAAAMNNEAAAVAAELLALGAEVNAPGPCGCTALMLAAANNANPAMIETLAKAGAEMDAQDRFGYTALMWAAGRNPRPDMAVALVKSGAKVDFKDREGRTALMGSTDNKNPGVIEALAKAGADVNAADANGMNVLGYARRYGDGTAAEKALVAMGAR